MVGRDVLAIGASAGGVAALRLLANQFPADLDAAVLVTIHLRHPSVLDEILTDAGPLPAAFAKDGEAVEKRRIYIAPPERHLLLYGEHLWLGDGPRENYSRPALDPMFRSAAVCCGARAIGVVLTGCLGDGALGLLALKRCGGIVVVQDPCDADYPDMPTATLGRVQADHIERLPNMADLLKKLVREPAGAPRPAPEDLKFEVEIAKTGSAPQPIDSVANAKRSVFSCPECGGVMWEFDDGQAAHYRCHVGHAYASEVLSAALEENVLRALAVAQRTLEDRNELMQKLHKEAVDKGRVAAAKDWARLAQETERQLGALKDSVKNIQRLGPALQR